MVEITDEGRNLMTEAPQQPMDMDRYVREIGPLRYVDNETIMGYAGRIREATEHLEGNLRNVRRSLRPWTLAVKEACEKQDPIGIKKELCYLIQADCDL